MPYSIECKKINVLFNRVKVDTHISLKAVVVLERIHKIQAPLDFFDTQKRSRSVLSGDCRFEARHLC